MDTKMEKLTEDVKQLTIQEEKCPFEIENHHIWSNDMTYYIDFTVLIYSDKTLSTTHVAFLRKDITRAKADNSRFDNIISENNLLNNCLIALFVENYQFFLEQKIKSPYSLIKKKICDEKDGITANIKKLEKYFNVHIPIFSDKSKDLNKNMNVYETILKPIIYVDNEYFFVKWLN